MNLSGVCWCLFHQFQYFALNLFYSEFADYFLNFLQILIINSNAIVIHNNDEEIKMIICAYSWSLIDYSNY